MTTEPKHTPWAWAEHREAFDRIVKQLASVQVLTQQRDALHAENERLREALREVSRLDYLQEHNALAEKVRAALASLDK